LIAYCSGSEVCRNHQEQVVSAASTGRHLICKAAKQTQSIKSSITHYNHTCWIHICHRMWLSAPNIQTCRNL